MSPEKQRIKIAEVCGWRGVHVPVDFSEHATPHTVGRPCGFSPVHATFGQIPDYLNDLNAMHEAEKVLNDEQKKIYTAYLHPKELHHYLMADFLVCHSSAAKRAEAFLRTIGKWEDE